MLQKTQDIEEMAILSYLYGVKMGYLIDDSEYEEALSIGTNRKKLIDKIHSLSNIPGRLYRPTICLHLFKSIAAL